MAEPVWSPSDIPWSASHTPASAPMPSSASPPIVLPATRGCYRMFLPPMAFPTGYQRSIRAHADLLDRLLGGHAVLHVKSRDRIYVCAGSPKRYGNMMTWVRLEDLTWRYEPGDQCYPADLVDLLQLRFSLDRGRPIAWELAVTLLQRVYARDFVAVEALVRSGDALRAAGGGRTGAPAGKAGEALTEARGAFLGTLYAAMGRGAA